MRSREHIFYETLHGENGIKKSCKVVFTRHAMLDCSEWDIVPMVAASLFAEAADYILRKNENDKFAIVSEELLTVVCGEVIYKDEEEVEVLVTSVYGDVHILKRRDFFKVD